MPCERPYLVLPCRALVWKKVRVLEVSARKRNRFRLKIYSPVAFTSTKRRGTASGCEESGVTYVSPYNCIVCFQSSKTRCEIRLLWRESQVYILPYAQ